jgi:hypothetical protein
MDMMKMDAFTLRMIYMIVMATALQNLTVKVFVEANSLWTIALCVVSIRDQVRLVVSGLILNLKESLNDACLKTQVLGRMQFLLPDHTSRTSLLGMVQRQVGKIRPRNKTGTLHLQEAIMVQHHILAYPRHQQTRIHAKDFAEPFQKADVGVIPYAQLMAIAVLTLLFIVLGKMLLYQVPKKLSFLHLCTFQHPAIMAHQHLELIMDHHQIITTQRLVPFMGLVLVPIHI